jgi:hypothetical protein
MFFEIVDGDWVTPIIVTPGTQFGLLVRETVSELEQI